MQSIGLDLQPWVDNGLLLFHATRPTLFGLEMHLVSMNKLVRDFKPSVVIMDPISNMVSVGSAAEVKSALMRFIDSLKMEGITALFTCLIFGQHQDLTEIGRILAHGHMDHCARHGKQRRAEPWTLYYKITGYGSFESSS